MRSNYSPSAGNTIIDKLKPYEGGLGVTDAPTALNNMGVLPSSQVGVPNGVAKLGSDGFLPVSSVPDTGFAPIGIQGASSLTVGTSTTFQITNYDVFTTYALAVIGTGTVTRNGSVITYNAPAAGEAGGFTINGRAINITVIGIQPNAPTLTAVDVVSGNSNAAFNCTGSAFSMTAGNNTHLNSDWQISSDTGFATIIQSSMADATNKTAWTSGALALSTTYYARVRYRDSAGTPGNWSNTVSITTKSSYTIATEEAKIIPAGTLAGDEAGFAVAISSDGSRIIIGTPWAANGSIDPAGFAHIYLRTGTTWALEQKLNPVNVSAQPSFGNSVSMSADGTRVAIGSYSYVGSVEIWLRTGTTWAREQTITPAANGEYFGQYMAMSADGTRFVVGTPTSNSGTVVQCGACRVYLRTGTTWAIEATLYASDKADSIAVGYAVAINNDGSRFIAGAIGVANTSGDQTGGAYVFVRSGTTWTQEAKITNPEPIAGANFGQGVSIDSTGLRVAVGAPYATQSSVNSSGKAFVFLRTGSAWALEQKIIPATPGTQDYYGWALSFSSDGSRLAIGSPGAYNGNAAQFYGFVQVADRSGTVWSLENKIIASDQATFKFFGQAVAMTPDGSRIVTGSPGNTNSSPYGGAAYVHR